MGEEIGRFRGPYGASNYWELPNRGYEWDIGISLGPYRTGPEHTMTPLGQRISGYKYSGASVARQHSLASELTSLTLSTLWERFDSPPFSFLIAVPPNHKGKPSLPRQICQNIANRYPDRFEDKSHAIRHLRDLDSVKGVYKGSRADYVRGAWGVDSNVFPKTTKRIRGPHR